MVGNSTTQLERTPNRITRAMLRCTNSCRVLEFPTVIVRLQQSVYTQCISSVECIRRQLKLGVSRPSNNLFQKSSDRNLNIEELLEQSTSTCSCVQVVLKSELHHKLSPKLIALYGSHNSVAFSMI